MADFLTSSTRIRRMMIPIQPALNRRATSITGKEEEISTRKEKKTILHQSYSSQRIIKKTSFS
jgi:hypothetical protein